MWVLSFVACTWSSAPPPPAVSPVADEDEDGLLDADEEEMGTDPLLADSDGDHYSDRDELFEGTDPTSHADRIYTGGWPYAYEKDFSDPGVRGFREPFQRVERWRFVDQYGQEVDLFDFENDDAPVVLDLQTAWSSAARGVSSWIHGRADPYGLGEVWRAGPAAVARGQVRWVTILLEDEDGQPATPAAAFRWSDRYTGEIPILADPNYTSASYLTAEWPGDPFLVLLTPDLRVEPIGDYIGDGMGVLDELSRRFPDARRLDVVRHDSALRRRGHPPAEERGLRRRDRDRGVTGALGPAIRKIGRWSW